MRMAFWRTTTSRTHSDSVTPARSARDSSTRSSASETFVPTDFVRNSRFIANRPRSVVKREMHEGRTRDARPAPRSMAGS
jgi:hypothetical protein